MITETDQAFLRGYKAAEKDVIALVSDSLWRHVNSLQKGFPELAEGIAFAIEIIEREFEERPSKKTKSKKK
jgi:hypothetical protein